MSLTSVEYLEAALALCVKNGLDVPERLLADLSALGVKTLPYFDVTFHRLVKKLFRFYITELEFVQIAEDLIKGQLTDAYKRAVKEDGYNKLTPDMQEDLDGIVQNEKAQIFDFAEAIVHGSADTSGADKLTGLMARADLWVNRFTDVYNYALLKWSKATQNFEWQLGETEQHCETCSKLNGIVANAEDWRKSGYHPQQPPNEKLECEGWRCDCHFVATDKPATSEGIPE